MAWNSKRKNFHKMVTIPIALLNLSNLEGKTSGSQLGAVFHRSADSAETGYRAALFQEQAEPCVSPACQCDKNLAGDGSIGRKSSPVIS